MEPSNDYEQQFRLAINDISVAAVMQLHRLSDRVRIAEWLRKLCSDPVSLSCSDSWPQIRNEYAQYLRIIMKGVPVRIVSPFTRLPPRHELPPLPEMLGNCLQKSLLVHMPRTGPIKPVICHTCGDGRAFMTVQRCPQSGAVYCYMAVAPDTLQIPTEQQKT